MTDLERSIDLYRDVVGLEVAHELPADEPSVIGWMPAAAVYFRDPDGHQLEVISMLDGKPRPDVGIVPWSRSPDWSHP